jgi:hypothetical protein
MSTVPPDETVSVLGRTRKKVPRALRLLQVLELVEGIEAVAYAMGQSDGDSRSRTSMEPMARV